MERREDRCFTVVEKAKDSNQVDIQDQRSVGHQRTAKKECLIDLTSRTGGNNQFIGRIGIRIDG